MNVADNLVGDLASDKPEVKEAQDVGNLYLSGTWPENGDVKVKEGIANFSDLA